MATTNLPEAPVPQIAAPPSQGGASSSTDPQTDKTAQQDGGSPQTKSGDSQSDKNADADLKAAEKQRMLGIMPAFNLVQGGTAPPLRPGQKFHLWYRSAIDPFTFALAGAVAGIEQAQDSFPEYGQGFSGYAKRFGAAYADNVDGNFWGNAVLPVVLHQDPRYFRLGHGSVGRRLWYAAISTVRCKGDNGKWQPSYSNVGGNIIGGAISNAYYPASDRGVGLTFQRAFTVTAEGAFGAVALEFYPDLASYWKRRHQQDAGTTTPAAAPAATPKMQD